MLMPGTASDPKNTISPILVLERDYRVKPMTVVDLKMRRIKKVYENTSQRIFVENVAQKFGPRRPKAVVTPRFL